ncbi:hypothetical protein QCO44_06680 [Selenomonas sputigena]|uniref:Uncharacterized protein n=1 Tax=Selenomonas sputigena TaxID=69823 RepID=A0ABV3X552_9FIRM
MNWTISRISDIRMPHATKYANQQGAWNEHRHRKILDIVPGEMVFGANGIFQIKFDNYNLANGVCSVALIFIMFYGGFGTKRGALPRKVSYRSLCRLRKKAFSCHPG